MMSEKRFYLGNNDTTICDRSQGGSDGFNMLTIFKVVDLLNELSEENEQLKAKASSWKITCSQEINEKNVLFMKNRQLKEENEQLKQSNDRFADTAKIRRLKDRIKVLEKNE